MNNVQVLFGVSGIKDAYGESLKEKDLSIMCLSEKYPDVIGDFFDKTFSPKLYGSKINTREILPDNKANRDYAQNKDQRKNQVRFIKNNLSSESDMILSFNKVVLISYDLNNPLAVVITDQELVNGFRAQFEALWGKLV